MKGMIGTIIATTSLNVLAGGILCQDDQRMADGHFKEVILISSPSKGSTLQARELASWDSPKSEIEVLASDLNCHIDNKMPLAYCEEVQGNQVLQFSERRIISLGSLAIDAKPIRETFVDISLKEKGGQKTKTFVFAANQCQSINS